MRIINTVQTVKIPEGVTVTAKNRIVVVKGERGKLSRNFRHLQMDIYVSLATSLVYIFL